MGYDYKFEISNEDDVDDILMELSHENPGYHIQASVTFGTMRVQISRRKPQGVDTPYSRFMMEFYNGVSIKDGEVVRPSQGWVDRNNRIPLRD